MVVFDALLLLAMGRLYPFDSRNEVEQTGKGSAARAPPAA
jgi:hypothetical protein